MSKTYWEIVADEIHAAGWSYGYTRARMPDGNRFYVADAHRNDGHRYIAHADDLLNAFLALKDLLWKAPKP